MALTILNIEILYIYNVILDLLTTFSTYICMKK